MMSSSVPFVRLKNSEDIELGVARTSVPKVIDPFSPQSNYPVPVLFIMIDYLDARTGAVLTMYNEKLLSEYIGHPDHLKLLQLYAHQEQMKALKDEMEKQIESEDKERSESSSLFKRHVVRIFTPIGLTVAGWYGSSKVIMGGIAANAAQKLHLAETSDHLNYLLNQFVPTCEQAFKNCYLKDLVGYETLKKWALESFEKQCGFALTDDRGVGCYFGDDLRQCSAKLVDSFVSTCYDLHSLQSKEKSEVVSDGTGRIIVGALTGAAMLATAIYLLTRNCRDPKIKEKLLSEQFINSFLSSDIQRETLIRRYSAELQLTAADESSIKEILKNVAAIRNHLDTEIKLLCKELKIEVPIAKLPCSFFRKPPKQQAAALEIIIDKESNAEKAHKTGIAPSQ